MSEAETIRGYIRRRILESGVDGDDDHEALAALDKLEAAEARVAALTQVAEALRPLARALEANDDETAWFEYLETRDRRAICEAARALDGLVGLHEQEQT